MARPHFDSKSRSQLTIQITPAVGLLLLLPLSVLMSTIVHQLFLLNSKFNSSTSHLSSVPGPLPLPPLRTDTANTTPTTSPHNDKNEKNRRLTDLPACASAGRARSFIMVFQGHSGSTALMTSLEQHSETHITGLEPIDHMPFVTPSGHPATPNASLAAAAYMETFFSNKSTSHLTSGFKVRPLHLIREKARFAEIVATYETRIIWSFRANIVKQAVGDYRIHAYGDKPSFEGLRVAKDGQSAPAPLRNASIAIHNMTKLLSLIRGRGLADRAVTAAVRAITEQQLRQSGSNWLSNVTGASATAAAPNACVLPVSYESYLRSPDVTLDRVQRFLGISPVERHSSLRAKANADSLCDLVSNFDDLCRELFGCSELRWMLDDYDNQCVCSALAPKALDGGKAACNVYHHQVKN